MDLKWIKWIFFYFALSLMVVGGQGNTLKYGSPFSSISFDSYKSDNSLTVSWTTLIINLIFWAIVLGILYKKWNNPFFAKYSHEIYFGLTAVGFLIISMFITINKYGSGYGIYDIFAYPAMLAMFILHGGLERDPFEGSIIVFLFIAILYFAAGILIYRLIKRLFLYNNKTKSGIKDLYGILVVLYFLTTLEELITSRSFNFDNNINLTIYGLFSILTFSMFAGTIGLLRLREWGRKTVFYSSLGFIILSLGNRLLNLKNYFNHGLVFSSIVLIILSTILNLILPLYLVYHLSRDGIKKNFT